MDKIVGNILASIFFCTITGWMTAQELLRLVNKQGVPIKHVYVGMPFKVEVTHTATQRTEPVIPGLNALHVIGKESRIQIINGMTSSVYAYHVQARQEGTYTLGPVKTEHGQESITFTAVAAPPSTSANDADSHQVFARLIVDKTTAFVGEKIPARIRFYCNDPAVSLSDIAESSISDCIIKARKGPSAGIQTINNKTYNYLEWEWDLYAKKAGVLTIPAYRVEYTVPEETQDDFFAAVSLFFKARRVKKRLYSNSADITISALPPYSGVVQALGSFHAIQARAHPARAREGEGIVLTIEIEGGGSIDDITAPVLQDMPEHFTWYDSKSYEGVSHQPGMKKKYFEYIIQCFKEGSWEIPKQSFTYFDCDQKKYTTIATQAVSVTIAAGSPKPLEQQKQLPVSPLVAQPTQVEPHDKIAPLEYKQEVFSITIPTLPWYIFVILFLLPLASLFGSIPYTLLLPRGRKRLRVDMHALRKTLITVRSDGAASNIHALFVRFFAQYAKLPENETTQDVIDSVVRQLLTPQEYEDWQLFFNRVMECAFYGNHNPALHIAPDIFDETERWLMVFEKKL